MRPRSASRRPRRRRPGPTRPRSSSTTSRTPSSPSERSVACWLCSGSRSSTGCAGALQRAVDGGDRRLERLRDLPGREAEHLAKDQHRALVGRQVLKRGDERELHGLALLVAGLGRGVAVLEAERLVRVRLDPDRLDQRARRARREDRSAARSRSGAPASAGARSRRGRRWSRSGRATSAASFGPRIRSARATRGAARPGARPRRREPSRASGSSGPGARERCGSTRLPNASSSPPRAASSSSRSLRVACRRRSSSSIRVDG